MRKSGRSKYYLHLLTFIIFFAGCKNDPGKRQMPRMAPPYMYLDKQPMGTNIAYRLLPQQFNGNILLASKNVNNLVNELTYVTGTAYISIGKNLQPGDSELVQLLDYVKKGNEFFISATTINYRLLDTLNIKSEYQPDSADEVPLKKSQTFLSIADSAVFGKQLYGFFYYPFRKIFTRYNSNVTKVLGINEKGEPNYLVVKYGLGKFYFHLAPAAFSNYFLLTGKNTHYYEQVFSYLNKDARQVYWADIDRFGKAPDDFSALAIFWANPPLRYALLLSSGLILFYIAFSSKRKRRLIPPRPINTNDSIGFVRTIGNLYLQKKDNRKIAVKMVTYFLEHVRSSYHINTSNIDTAFIHALSVKSAVPEDTVKVLMEWAEHINNTQSITDQELFIINNLIYQFYKR